MSHGKGPVNFPEAVDSVARPPACSTTVTFLYSAPWADVCVTMKGISSVAKTRQGATFCKGILCDVRGHAAYNASLLSVVSITDDGPVVCHITPDLAQHAAVRPAIWPCIDNTCGVEGPSCNCIVQAH